MLFVIDLILIRNYFFFGLSGKIGKWENILEMKAFFLKMKVHRLSFQNHFSWPLLSHGEFYLIGRELKKKNRKWNYKEERKNLIFHLSISFSFSFLHHTHTDFIQLIKKGGTGEWMRKAPFSVHCSPLSPCLGTLQNCLLCPAFSPPNSQTI